jgi:hypothetical protein
VIFEVLLSNTNKNPLSSAKINEAPTSKIFMMIRFILDVVTRVSGSAELKNVYSKTR